MEEYIMPSAIAMVTSLIVSILSHMQFVRASNNQQEQFSKNLNRDLTMKLYNLRIDVYPKAFEITDNIHKLKGGNYDPLVINSALLELLEWRKGLVDLIISIEALESYIALRDCLMKKPEKNNLYSDKQVENITLNTKNFRRQLRRDIGFLFREEKERRRQ